MPLADVSNGVLTVHPVLVSQFKMAQIASKERGPRTDIVLKGGCDPDDLNVRATTQPKEQTTSL
jgi:hypothetical protein